MCLRIFKQSASHPTLTHTVSCAVGYGPMRSARLECACARSHLRLFGGRDGPSAIRKAEGERGRVHGFRKTTAHTPSQPQHLEPPSQRAEGGVGCPESRKQFSNPRNAADAGFTRSNSIVAPQRRKAIVPVFPALRTEVRELICDFRTSIDAFSTALLYAPLARRHGLPDSCLTICHKAGPPFRRDRS